MREIRRHPAAIRYALLAAYCVQQEEEITDTLIDLLINVIHRIEKRAERTVDKQVLRDVKRIRGKHRLLYEVAQASINQPEGTVKDVIYPIAPEQTLRSRGLIGTRASVSQCAYIDVFCSKTTGRPYTTAPPR